MNNGGTTGPESGDTPAGASDHSTVGAGSGAAAASSSASSAEATAGNPFADMKVGDLIRDAVAIALLLISFGMPWDAFESSTGRLYVVFATLISIASLALPYLRRGGILPDMMLPAKLLSNSQILQARLLHAVSRQETDLYATLFNIPFVPHEPQLSAVPGRNGLDKLSEGNFL